MALSLFYMTILYYSSVYNNIMMRDINSSSYCNHMQQVIGYEVFGLSYGKSIQISIGIKFYYQVPN